MQFPKEILNSLKDKAPINYLSDRNNKIMTDPVLIYDPEDLNYKIHIDRSEIKIRDEHRQDLPELQEEIHHWIKDHIITAQQIQADKGPLRAQQFDATFTMMLIGAPGVGKTLLADRLTGKKPAYTFSGHTEGESIYEYLSTQILPDKVLKVIVIELQTTSNIKKYNTPNLVIFINREQYLNINIEETLNSNPQTCNNILLINNLDKNMIKIDTSDNTQKTPTIDINLKETKETNKLREYLQAIIIKIPHIFLEQTVRTIVHSLQKNAHDFFSIGMNKKSRTIEKSLNLFLIAFNSGLIKFETFEDMLKYKFDLFSQPDTPTELNLKSKQAEVISQYSDILENYSLYEALNINRLVIGREKTTILDTIEKMISDFKIDNQILAESEFSPV